MKVTIIDKAGKRKTMAASHADVLVRIGRATYMTRDMAAVPVAPLTPAAEPAEPPVVKPESLIVPAANPSGATGQQDAFGGGNDTDDVDSAGAKWDENLHVSTKTKNADGTWRKKPSRSGE